MQEQKAHLRAAQDRVLSLETSVNELNTQLNESREKVSQLDIQVILQFNMNLYDQRMNFRPTDVLNSVSPSPYFSSFLSHLSIEKGWE